MELQTIRRWIVESAVWDALVWAVQSKLVMGFLWLLVSGALAWVNQNPILVIWLVASIGLALGLFISNQVASKRSRFPSIHSLLAEFYETRSSAPDVVEEIRSSEGSWAIMYQAQHLHNQQVFADEKPQRLIMLDPNGDYLKIHAPVFGNTLEEVQTQINGIIEKWKAKITIRLISTPVFFNMTIFEPRKENSRIRIETPIQGERTNSFPILYVTKKDHPKAYEAYVGLFERLWDDKNKLTKHV